MPLDKEGAAEVALRGKLVTLLAETVVDDGTTDPTYSTAVTLLDKYSMMVVLLTVSAKSISAGTLNIYVQGSPDQGTTWDDIVAFTQVTSAAVANGSYVAFVNSNGASVADRAVTNGTLTANSVRSIAWGDRLRVKLDPASFDGDDTVTIKVQARMVS